MAKKKQSKRKYLPLFIAVFSASLVFLGLFQLSFGYVRSPEYQLSPIPVITGIYGKATLSPTCTGPKRSVDVCSSPFQGKFKAINTTDNKVTSFSTAIDGLYKIKLDPGTYKIVLDNSKSKFPRLSVPFITVSENRLTEQPLILDSGVR